jgi:hypothetical protein
MRDRIERYAAKHVRRIIAKLIRCPGMASLMAGNSQYQDDHIDDQMAYKIYGVDIPHFIKSDASQQLRYLCLVSLF